jgi:hypothetical protein
MPRSYLASYAEPEARSLADIRLAPAFEQVLVVPAYRESSQRAAMLARLAASVPRLLVILVINQPDSDTSDANRPIHTWLEGLGGRRALDDGASLYPLPRDGGLLAIERAQPLPARRGVGLARKIGCDVALAWQRNGQVRSPWIHCGDADALQPAARFTAVNDLDDAAAACFPFHHLPPDDVVLPMTLYELKLHYYVLGLRFAGSGYAYHSLSSCLSVTGEAYAAVRGFPRRAAAEDFYLLNKLAKVGPVATPTDPVIILSGRRSDRVPFGTGAAVTTLATAGVAADAQLFYHPASFRALRTLLATLDPLWLADNPLVALEEALTGHGDAAGRLQDMGLGQALQHARDHAGDAATFKRHLLGWFDGFRTLKFIHAMRESGYPDQSLAESLAHPARIWPDGVSATSPLATLQECRRALGWSEQQPADIAQQLAELGDEPSAVAPVDHPVIVGQGDRE